MDQPDGSGVGISVNPVSYLYLRSKAPIRSGELVMVHIQLETFKTRQSDMERCLIASKIRLVIAEYDSTYAGSGGKCGSKRSAGSLLAEALKSPLQLWWGIMTKRSGEHSVGVPHNPMVRCNILDLKL